MNLKSQITTYAVPYFLPLELEEVGGNDNFLVIYFFKNKTKIVTVFSYHIVKLIILKGLKSILVYYLCFVFFVLVH